jgi:precorrin-6B C5,15-methyltransferase / cobalt-precorrin-6B C5,C15-methyltransferase
MRWLSIIGIGEDGVSGLSPAALAALSAAETVWGGKRHLDLAQEVIRGNQQIWPNPIEAAFPAIVASRGKRMAVLASGDPFHYGIGSLIARHVPPSEIAAFPKASSLSLAAARLGWALQDCAIVSVHGRPLENVMPHLTHAARLLVLAWDGSTAGKLAALLTALGHGDARLHLLEALEGPQERVSTRTASEAALLSTHALTVIGVEMPAAGGIIWPLTPGLADHRFDNDGQLTRQDMRVITLARLAPQPGQLLWDIGGGSGSIGIEWMLRHPANRAIVVERNEQRVARIRANAAALGVVRLDIRHGSAPEALKDLPPPDAVFIGGGTSNHRILDAAAAAAFAPGKRCVANAVTVEGEQALLAAASRHGGEVNRFSFDRLDKVGPYRAWRPAMSVVQWVRVKSSDAGGIP